MAFDIQEIFGYGDGRDGAVTNSNISDYLRYGKISGKDNGTNRIYTTNTMSLSPGDEVLIHHSLYGGSDTSDSAIADLGRWEIRKVLNAGTYMGHNCIWLDREPYTNLLFYVQVIRVVQASSLTVNDDISPPAYSTTYYTGGILAIKVSGTASLNYYGIDLVEKGIPTSAAGSRPLTYQERNGTFDTDKLSGLENSLCKTHMPLNVGNGAIFLFAKNISTNANFRIGGKYEKGIVP